MSANNGTGMRRQIQFLIFSLVVSIGIFSYLLSKVSWQEVVDIIRNIPMIWVLLFLIFSFSMSFFRTWRYQLVLNVSGYRVDNVALFLITLVRNFFSDLLPARLGTLIYIYLVKNRMGLPLGPILSSFAHAFIFDIISLAILILPALAVTALGPQSTLILAAVAVVLGAVAFMILTLLPYLCGLAEKVTEKFSFLPEKWRHGLQTIFQESAHHISLAQNQGVFWKVLALSFGVRACKYLSYYMLFLGLLLPLGFSVSDFPLEKVFLGLCSAELAASLPISGIAGFGAYEGAWALVFQLLGYPERIAVLSSISHHLFTQVYGYLLGAVALLVLLLPMFKQQKRDIDSPDQGTERRFWMRFTLTVFVISVLTYLLMPFDEGNVEANGETATIRDLPAGRIVYERNNGIYLTDIGSTESVRLAEDGKHPRWSPDGRSVVFIRNNSIMVADIETKKHRLVTQVKQPATVRFGADNKTVLFSDGKSMFRIGLNGKGRKEIARDGRFFESSMDSSGKRLAATVKTRMGYKVRVFDLSDGTVRSVAKGCSASISPRGDLVTVLDSAHKVLYLYDWSSLKKAGQVKAPAGTKFDNHAWSNHPDWLVSTSEGELHDILLHHVPTGAYRKITSTGDGDRADLHVAGSSS
jgi:uncharacterized protein (TIRG00374 family)